MSTDVMLTEGKHLSAFQCRPMVYHRYTETFRCFREILRLGSFIAAISCLVGCGGTTPAASVPDAGTAGGASMTMTLTSTAFAEGAAIPAKYTCDGADGSPPLHW